MDLPLLYSIREYFLQFVLLSGALERIEEAYFREPLSVDRPHLVGDS